MFIHSKRGTTVSNQKPQQKPGQGQPQQGQQNKPGQQQQQSGGKSQDAGFDRSSQR